MKILILGGDGYLGWPTGMYLSRRGHDVAVLDNFAKRRWKMELNVEPLIPIRPLHDRVDAWHSLTGKRIELFVRDLRNYGVVEGVLDSSHCFLCQLIRCAGCPTESEIRAHGGGEPHRESRVELDGHHYSLMHDKLLSLRLQPHYLSDLQLQSMLTRIEGVKRRIKCDIILPQIKWDGETQQIEELKLMWAGA